MSSHRLSLVLSLQETTLLSSVCPNYSHCTTTDCHLIPLIGAPYTLSQSQSYIISGPLGARISFYNAHPTSYLSSLPESTQKYDYVVLSHCIWYFSSPTQLSSLVSATAPWTKSLCLAEWSLRASKAQAQPHVLTALLLASLEAKRKEEGSGNIRTVLSPVQIRSVRESSSSPQALGPGNQTGE